MKMVIDQENVKEIGRGTEKETETTTGEEVTEIGMITGTETITEVENEMENERESDQDLLDVSCIILFSALYYLVTLLLIITHHQFYIISHDLYIPSLLLYLFYCHPSFPLILLLWVFFDHLNSIQKGFT